MGYCEYQIIVIILTAPSQIKSTIASYFKAPLKIQSSKQNEALAKNGDSAYN